MTNLNNMQQSRTFLQTKCQECKGLCCILLYCFQQDGFPNDKEAMVPCKHLEATYQCTIHDDLHKQHLHGCFRYDCSGAGNHICNLANNQPIFPNAYMKMVQLHQILQYLLEVSQYREDEDTLHRIDELYHTWLINVQSYEVFLAFDLEQYRLHVNHLLKDMIRQIKQKYSASSPTLGRECIGKDLRNYTLQGVDFSMKYLMASNLSAMDLKDAIFLGTDVRDVNICDSDLSNAHFLTQMQVNTMIGNTNTILPKFLVHPKHW